MLRAAIISVAFIAPLGAEALTLAACERTTHISHAGEDLHRDLGEGRVMWREWWSQEGTFETLIIADCADAKALYARTAENGMANPLPFDRTDRALAAIDKVHEGSRVFTTLERVSDRLDRLTRDRRIAMMDMESCACAAAYPDLRGDMEAFTWDQ